VKGIINTTQAIPRGVCLKFPLIQRIQSLSGVMDIVASVHEGFYNAPKLYGSKVRKTGKVTGFASGLKEGGKVLKIRFCRLWWLITV
jgi:hypothetical protein